MMDRARAAHLISGGLAGDESDPAEDFSHGHPGPDFSEANARHGGASPASPPTGAGRPEVDLGDRRTGEGIIGLDVPSPGLPPTVPSCTSSPPVSPAR